MAILKPRAYTALEGTAVATVPICDALFSFSLSLSLTHHGRHQRFFVALTMIYGGHGLISIHVFNQSSRVADAVNPVSRGVVVL